MTMRPHRTPLPKLGPPLESEEDRRVHGAHAYDPIRGVFTTALSMMPVDTPPGLGLLGGWPHAADLAELWERATRTNIAHTGIPSALASTCGAQLRLWQVEALVELLPQDSPARAVLHGVAVEATMLLVGEQLP